MRTTRGPLAILLWSLLLAGCSNDKSPTGLGNAGAQDQADDLALQTVASVTLAAGDLGAAVGTVPAGAATPARAQWDTTFTQGALTFVATRAFFDSGDNLLPGYGPTAVKMTWTSRVFGTVEYPRDTATVIHRATVDVHGIQPGQDTLRFDGGVFDTLTNRFRSYDGTRVRYGFWRSYSTIEDVRLLKSALAAGLGYPIHGRLSFAVTLDRLRSNNLADVESHLEATVVVAFDGTILADVVVNGSYRYKWNLVNGQVARV